MANIKDYFKKDFQKILEGNNEKSLKKLQKKFAKDRLIDIEQVLSPQGLKKLKASFDKLKNKEEYSEEKHKKISGIDSFHVEKEPFVSLLLKSEEFRVFLVKLTQFDELHIRKSKRANINISTDSGHFYEWHFDGHGITVIFPLDSPKKGHGGEFAYYPNFRKVGASFFNRAFTKVLFITKMHDIFFKKKILRYTPGNLVVFDGDTTMHAALPLRKKDYRRIVILHYVKD